LAKEIMENGRTFVLQDAGRNFAANVSSTTWIGGVYGVTTQSAQLAAANPSDGGFEANRQPPHVASNNW
jgi:hypothetical protein